MVTVKINKSQFFDRPAVVRAAGRGRVKALSRAGAFIRQRARSSMRRRKAVAAAGTPPSAHTGDLKRLIYFGYDQQRGSVLVGPVPFRKGDAAELNEFGGRALRRDPRGNTFVAVYEPRPFMGPALRAEAPNLPRHWRNVVSSS